MTLKKLCNKYKIRNKDLERAEIMSERMWQYYRQDNSRLLKCSLWTIESIREFLYYKYGEEANQNFSDIIEIQLKNRKVG